MNDRLMCTVDAEALREVLMALIGPGHLIRELQATRGPLFNNPIDRLVSEYNMQATQEASKEPT